jgi:hypothetical protein
LIIDNRGIKAIKTEGIGLSIGIIDIIDDHIKTCNILNDKVDQVRVNKIYYTNGKKENKPYFFKNGSRQYIEEFQRI